MLFSTLFEAKFSGYLRQTGKFAKAEHARNSLLPSGQLTNVRIRVTARMTAALIQDKSVYCSIAFATEAEGRCRQHWYRIRLSSGSDAKIPNHTCP
jgi:hypothetical protein